MLSILKHPLKAMFRRNQRKFEDGCAVDVHAILDGEFVTMVDVGASGGVLPRWYPCRRDISFIGIEPDKRSSEDLMNSEEAKGFQRYRVIPHGAWDVDGEVSISFTRKPMCSSHYQPNTELLGRFPDFERFDIVGSGNVECQTLDALIPDSADAPDFMKMDLEGGELAVLHGARNILKSCMALHVEVGFQYLRKGQPLFGEVCDYLINQGIEFNDFLYICRWERSVYREAGQCFFGDALFLRSPENVFSMLQGEEIGFGRVKSYLAVLAVYERYDIALTMLDMLLQPGIETSYVKQAKNIMQRRKESFDSRFRMLGRLNLLMQYKNPNSQLHYFY